jgi:membrane associated rhomboid family serine protease
VAGTGSGGGKPPGNSAWQLGRGDAEEVLAEARKAFFVMVAFLAILWIVQIANWADHYQLTFNYGIFLHVSWTHIEGNSGPLFIFGFLAAYRGVRKFLGVTLVVIITSGLGAWIFQSPGSVGVGASGVVFGYFGYIIVKGLFDKHPIDLVVGLVMALCFAYQFTVLLPQQGIGWQDHIGGVVGGVLAGWLFREGWRKSADGPDQPDRDKPRPDKSRRGKPGDASLVPADHPRSDLYKELKDMGL